MSTYVIDYAVLLLWKENYQAAVKGTYAKDGIAVFHLAHKQQNYSIVKGKHI
jgi:hypothetical protein